MDAAGRLPRDHFPRRLRRRMVKEGRRERARSASDGLRSAGNLTSPSLLPPTGCASDYLSSICPRRTIHSAFLGDAADGGREAMFVGAGPQSRSPTATLTQPAPTGVTIPNPTHSPRSVTTSGWTVSFNQGRRNHSQRAFRVSPLLCESMRPFANDRGRSVPAAHLPSPTG